MQMAMEHSRKTWHLFSLLVIVSIGSLSGVICEDTFSFTGFPEVATGAGCTIICNHPGGSDYVWRSPKGVTSSGYSHSFTATYNDHNGLWKCEVIVNGQKKIGEANLFVYCSGKFVTSASTTNPSLGDSIELKCRVNSPSGSEVQWQLTTPGATSGVAVAAVQEQPNTCVVYKEKNNRKWSTSTTCQTSTSNYNFNLIILKTRKSDVGYWSCMDFRDTECYSRPVRISFAKPPRDPPTLKGFTNPIVGTNHTLTCNAWQPFVRLLTYTWFKDAVPISQGNSSTWLLRPVVKGANGKYRCEVEDKVKNLKVKAEDTLVVYYAASWNTAIPKKVVTKSALGRSVNLTLNVLAYPAPSSVEWFFKVDSNTSVVVNYTSTKISDGSWVLSIPSVTEKDYGNYTVNVTNTAGSTFFNYQVVRPDPPDPPTNLTGKSTGPNALILSFIAGSDGGAQQTFTVEYYPKGRTEDKELMKELKDPVKTKTVQITVYNLMADTTYEFRVKAINDLGESEYSETLEAKTEAGGMPLWQMIAIGVGALLFLIIVFLVIFFVARRKYTEPPGEIEGEKFDPRKSTFIPAGVPLVEKEEEGPEGEVNTALVITDEKELEKIESVEGVAVTPRFYADLNERIKKRATDKRKSASSPFVNKELAPAPPADEYAEVDFRSKTRYRKNPNADRQSKATSKLYAAVDFAKKKLRKDSKSEEDTPNGKANETPPNVGVDGTVYSEVNLARNRPPKPGKQPSKKKSEPQEQTPYAEVNFDRSAPPMKTDEFELV